MNAIAPRDIQVRSAVSPLATFVLALTRIIIGWHFLYEGLAKIFTPKWSAAGFLKGSVGPLSEFFKSLAANDAAMVWVNRANAWGLAIIGAALMLGFLTRLAALAGFALLGLYYAAYMPLPWVKMPAGAEGHYLVINRNVVEMVALLVVVIFPAKALGLDGLVFGCRKVIEEDADPGVEPHIVQRRSILAGLATLPFVGAFVMAYLKRHGWRSHEEKNLDAFSGATSRTFDFTFNPKDVKGTMPQGKIGKLNLSRMILGGNLMGGWAHARDLIYVSKLVKAYHHPHKIFETFQIAEACGVNTILTNPALCGVINDYWKTTGGKIHFISDCGAKDLLGTIQLSIDKGAAACYVQGGIADQLVERKEFDTIAKALELIRKNNLPAGIGGHKLATVTACVEKGLIPDFWMKTLHTTKYWSARLGEKQFDNIWCEQPDETVAYMKERPEPWIAFKILAAGAIQPKQGFQYAFASGADFICVGMYDFQIVEDVNLALDVLNGKLVRQRQWRA